MWLRKDKSSYLSPHPKLEYEKQKRVRESRSKEHVDFQ